VALAALVLALLLLRPTVDQPHLVGRVGAFEPLPVGLHVAVDAPVVRLAEGHEIEADVLGADSVVAAVVQDDVPIAPADEAGPGQPGGDVRLADGGPVRRAQVDRVARVAQLAEALLSRWAHSASG